MNTVFEEQTFDVMWKLSEPGSEAEECFLRVPQTEFFFVPRPQPEPLEKMPNVSARWTHYHISLR